MFSKKDEILIEGHGLSIESAQRQMRYFLTGFPFLKINRPATPGDGILTVGPSRVEELLSRYDKTKDKLKIVKFVPASGAATRMFKDMYEFLNTGKPNHHSEEVAANIDKFAFGEILGFIAGKNATSKELISCMVGDGLHYGSLPKALILFHKYDDGNRTALEEHLAEGALYAAGAGNNVNIHFTVSPEHLEAFETRVAEVKGRFEKMYGVTYSISYSQQSPATDTIAVTPDNEPFRDAEGNILFRPAGHGALLDNLNTVEADIIYIKNIDNVAPDHLKGDTVKYKRVLGGLLLELQSKVFEYMGILDACRFDLDRIGEIRTFVEEALNYHLPDNFDTMPEETQGETLREILNRPLRVCGMVRNEGEPGGGPFWVAGDDGEETLQIAESSQISPEQKPLIRESTHFNPVDIVCGVRDHLGRKFDLSRFSDPDTGFISEKSKDGRPLKAQELPGLWNGSMAKWNTVLVEVPVTTFSPVKIVNDLLRPQHQ